MTLAALDIETCCDVKECEGFGGSSKCLHALDHNRNRITLVGVYAILPETGLTFDVAFDTIEDFKELIDDEDCDFTFIAHNGKFDFKHLIARGIDLTDRWVADTQLLSSIIKHKIPDEWLKDYELQRKEENKKIVGTHRKARKTSLKSLAPYFLDVPRFWEDPSNHDDPEYCLKDCEYTYRLYKLFKVLSTEEEWKFYEETLLPWSKMLMRSELKGIAIDMPELEIATQAAFTKATHLKELLETAWAPGIKAWTDTQIEETCKKYRTMRHRAGDKAGSNADRYERVQDRYRKLRKAALDRLEPFNIDSPTQLLWLLESYLGYDMADFEENSSTAVEVLEVLAGEGKEDIKLLLQYRKQQTLATKFFPGYQEKQYKGVLHGSFNPTGTRTGRLSSSNPNLQQVPSGLHFLFVARPDKKLITLDFSAIEPRIIAYLSEDPVLCEVLAEGVDFHGLTTKIFFNLDCHPSEVKKLYPIERKIGKEVGLSIFYGAGAKRLKRSVQKHGFFWTIEECASMVKEFRASYAGVFDYKKQIDKKLEAGEVIYNLIGRPIYIENADDVYMKGFNTLIQSSASDLLLNSAHKFEKEMEGYSWDAHPLLYVHDELVVEAPADGDRRLKAMKLLEHCMTNYTLTTAHGPVKIEVEGQISDRWEK